MPETKRRRRASSPTVTRRPKPNISRPRRTSTAKHGRFSRGLTLRTKPQPTGVKRILGALTGSGSKKGGAAAAGGLALIAGGLAALRKRRSGPEPPAPGPVTNTSTYPDMPADSVQPVAQDRP
jgi:hypothetical protein